MIHPGLILSSDEDSESQCSTPDNYLPGNFGDSYDKMNSFMAQPYELSDTAQITIPTCDPNLPGFSISMVLDGGSSVTKTSYNLLKQQQEILRGLVCNPLNHTDKCQIPDTTGSLTPSKSVQPDLFRPYNFPDNPSTSNTHPMPNINLVIRELQKLALHAHTENITQRVGV